MEQHWSEQEGTPDVASSAPSDAPSGETDREPRGEPRHIVELEGKYRARMGRSRDIWIKDVSQTGCRFFDRYSILDVGATISFRIGSIGPICAEVRWRERSTVGIRFEQPLHPAVLEHVVRAMDEGHLAA